MIRRTSNRSRQRPPRRLTGVGLSAANVVIHWAASGAKLVTGYI
jgi:hypothetical protein